VHPWIHGQLGSPRPLEGGVNLQTCRANDRRSGGPQTVTWRAMCANPARASRGRSSRPLNQVVYALSIGAFAVADPDDRDDGAGVIDLVDNPIRVLANAVLLPCSEPLTTRGSRIAPARPDSGDDALTVLLGSDGIELLGGRGRDEQPIVGHAASSPSRRSRRTAVVRQLAGSTRRYPRHLREVLGGRPR
jgi:hypothetical protein